MDAYLARQAVFDRALGLFGYGIRFRSDPQIPAPPEAGPQAVETALHDFGLGTLVSGKKAFLTFTKAMLATGLARLLPPAQTVVEIAESTQVDGPVLDACRFLKKGGYQVALESFVPGGKLDALVPVADYLKVDFKAVPPELRQELARKHGGPSLKLLADRVDTRAEFSEAMQAGYTFFGGAFFSKPEFLARKEIAAHKLSYLRILREVGGTEIDFDAVERCVKEDVSLSLKLLRYINSALFGLRAKVGSIKQALVLLGGPLVRKWVSLLALAAMGDDKPSELVVSALVRARFCEGFAGLLNAPDQAFELFMVGMFSHVDALLDRPMTEIAQDLPLPSAVKEVLLGHPGGHGRVLRVVEAYEKADWHRLGQLLAALSVDEKKVPPLYREAVAWADRVQGLGGGSE